MGYWKMNCKYAPEKPTAKHCKKYNEGGKSNQKAETRGKLTGKGNYGCSYHCKYYQPKKKWFKCVFGKQSKENKKQKKLLNFIQTADCLHAA